MTGREGVMRERPARDRIVAAYIDLLQERDAEDITIKELVSRANANRTSFYNHFKSLNAVAEHVMGGFLDTFRNVNATRHDGSWFDAGIEGGNQDLVDMLSFCYDHRKELYALFNGSLRNEFVDRLVAAVLEEYERYDYELYYADGSPAQLSPQELGYQLHVGAYVTVAYLDYWALTGFQETPEELGGAIPRLMGLSQTRSRRAYRVKRAGE